MTHKRYSLLLLLPMVLYMAISLRRGEAYPFSRTPMYNSLPNWAYVFFIVDERGDTLFANANFGSSRNTGNMASVFYTYCNQHHFSYGYGQELPEQRREAGEAVLRFAREGLQQQGQSKGPLRLVRRYLFWEDGELRQTDELIARDDH